MLSTWAKGYNLSIKNEINMYAITVKLYTDIIFHFIFQGKANNLGLAYHYIFGSWTKESSNNIINRNKPVFCVFDRLPNALDEHKIQIHVPIERDEL